MTPQTTVTVNSGNVLGTSVHHTSGIKQYNVNYENLVFNEYNFFFHMKLLKLLPCLGVNIELKFKLASVGGL